MASIVPRGFLLDRSRDHVSVGVLRDLTRDENEVTRAHGGMERQVRILFSDRIDVLATSASVAHGLRPSAKCVGFDDIDAANAIDEVD